MILNDLRLSKSMKYTALCCAMRFFENVPDIFEKEFDNGTKIKIDLLNQTVYINNEKTFELNNHESFVKLECINRLLSLGYELSDFTLLHGECEMLFKGYEIQFIIWDNIMPTELLEKKVVYKSRLISGVLEYKCKIQNNDLFDYGLFEKKCLNPKLRKQKKVSYNVSDFVIEENKVIKYTGKSSKVVVPYGIEELESSSFWDNQYIEEVVLPETLINMGGDTFYNCKSMKKINIPSSVTLMGNNPFAGCPLIEITNNSSNFIYENGALYTADRKTMIYYSIKGKETEFIVPESVVIICKHTFFLCDRLEKITLPTSLKKMENNPFSGCSKLDLINNSKSYFIKDDVIYNGFKTSVVGTLNKIYSKRLELLDGIKTINRNSFWNCKGIETIVFPESLNDIGYNPFVGCINIHFESHTPFFNVVNDVLCNKDCSKIICYPAWKAKGKVTLPDSIITLERGAFSRCSEMTELELHNVNIINKSCFTDCSSLKRLYCSDLITYIGEWTFAYCSSLEEISVAKNTIIDSDAFSNCPAKLIIRENKSNYLFESDNLFTLKSMQSAYKSKIDSILIDPPYNSNIDYIKYKDSNYENGYYNFMLERIELSYKLLSDTGFMIINIDEGEIDGLTKLCQSIFGVKLVEVHKWKKLHEFFDKNRDVKPDKKVILYEYIIICKKTEKAHFKKLMQPYIDEGIIKEKETTVPEIFDCFGTTSSAKDEICGIFGKRDYFSTPKPLKLIKELIRATTEKDSIIVDFFAGSGTVGHACLELNKEDGGDRKFILISNNESNICEKVANKRLEKAVYINDGSFEFLK